MLMMTLREQGPDAKDITILLMIHNHPGITTYKLWKEYKILWPEPLRRRVIRLEKEGYISFNKTRQGSTIYPTALASMLLTDKKLI